jgi:Leucine Rich repeat
MRQASITLLALLLLMAAKAQGHETLLFSGCPPDGVLADSLRAATRVRLYDGCWVELLDQMPLLYHVNATGIQLEGAFPPSVWDGVRYLSVQNNAISRIICSHLPQVEELDVAGNPLDEVAMAMLIDSLPRLKTLRIGGSLITDLKLPENNRIRRLDLCCESDLTRIYGGWSGLHLEKLILAGCSLEGNELGIRDSRVDSLDLALNQIAVLDADGLPSTLTYLDLSFNPLEGFQGKWGKLRHLESLELRGCVLKEMPEQLSKQRSISKLWLDGTTLLNAANEITCQGLPPNLEALWIDLDSRLEPPALPSCKAWGQLKEISFFGNVPPDLSALNALKHLRALRIVQCSRKSIDLALSTLGKDRRLVVWVPPDCQRLHQKYPHFDFRRSE